MKELTWIDDDAALDLLDGRGSWRQYPAYSACAAERIGARSRYALITDQNGPIALANCRTKRVAGGLLATTLVSHGPVLLRQGHQTDLDCAVTSLRDTIAGTEKGELTIDPDPLLAERGLTISSGMEDQQGYRTITLDVSGDEDTIRKAFNGKWRTDLRRAEKEGLELSTSEDPDDFALLAPMLEKLSREKSFSVPQDAQFFSRCSSQARGPERFAVQLVRRDGELLSVHLGAYSGETAVYLLGATSEAGYPVRAAYLAQWGAILTAKRFGIERYDTGGIDPEENPAVHRFKKRMGGEDRTAQPNVTFAAPALRGVALSLAKAMYAKIGK